MSRGRRHDVGGRNELVIYHNPLGSLTFDPTITTSGSTTISWKTEIGETITSGTTHNFSYTPTTGAKKCTVTVRGGLGLVTAIDGQSDAITALKLSKLYNLLTIDLSFNVALSGRLSEISRKATSLKLSNDSVMLGDVADLPRTLTTCFINSCTSIVGLISDLPPILTSLYIYTSSISGSISNLPTTLQTCFAYNCVALAGSIAHLTAIRDFRIHSMGWNTANVDTVLLSVSDSVWADANHYTYSAPSLQIGGTNPAPGGSSGADTTAPTTTPGIGNSNTDWQWDADRSAHKALTGKAAIYFLKNLASHAWNITYS